MATLQSSGAISLSQVQAVMGGANPISLSEYYRGGAYVPSTKTVDVREPTSGEYFDYTSPAPFYTWLYYPQTLVDDAIYWYPGGPNPLRIARGSTSYTYSGYTYFKGTFRVQTLASYTVYSNWHAIYRTSPSTVSINGNVPTSGAISLSNFYGAEKP